MNHINKYIENVMKMYKFFKTWTKNWRNLSRGSISH